MSFTLLSIPTVSILVLRINFVFVCCFADKKLPQDDNGGDWLVPLAIIVAAMLLIAIVIISVKWCISRNKYKYLNNKETSSESVQDV